MSKTLLLGTGGLVTTQNFLIKFKHSHLAFLLAHSPEQPEKIVHITI